MGTMNDLSYKGYLKWIVDNRLRTTDLSYGEWKEMMKCCEQALTIIPNANGYVAANEIEERMLIMLADAA